jgi:hypothetical protein
MEQMAKNWGWKEKLIAGYLPLYALRLIFPYEIGDCENRAAHVDNVQAKWRGGFLPHPLERLV